MTFNEAISKSVQDRQKEQVSQNRQQRVDLKNQSRQNAQQSATSNIQNQRDFEKMKELQKNQNAEPNNVGDLEQVTNPDEKIQKKELKYERPGTNTRKTGTRKS